MIKRITLIVCFGISSLQADPLLIVITTTDLAHFASRVGGSRVRTESLVRASEDPHRIAARPDFILKASNADGFVEMGLDLESGWSPVLLAQSRNSRIQKGAPGYCDASAGVRVLEKPQKPVDRFMGDVHAFGNPHYHLDPLNALIAARNIRDMLIRIDPAGAEDYGRGFALFADSLKRLAVEETRKFTAFKGLKVAVYHREFVYFASRFGLEEAGSIEEKPGVPPSAAHILAMTEKLKSQNVRLILRAPWNDARTTDSVAARIKARVLVLPISVDRGQTYEALIQEMGSRIRESASGQ